MAKAAKIAPDARTAHIDKYYPFNVVEGARQRILWCYEAFDCPLVSFSGGKDSLAVLMLAIEACTPLGIRPHACFIDEEFVPSRTVDFVKWVFYESPFANLIVPHWFCWQMDSEIYCAGTSETVVQWGKDRKEWLREPPPYALMDQTQVYDIYSPDKPLAKIFPGKSVVSLLGVRASESYARMKTVCQSAKSKDFPCFVRRGQVPSVYRAVPLYDWQTNDVLKYLSERNIINPIYYEMLCAGKALRTDTPLHGRRCNIAAFKKIDPPFFDKLCQLFPNVHTAALYNAEVKPLKELVDLYAGKYGRTWGGLLEYVRKEIPDTGQRPRAESLLRDAAKKHSRMRRKGQLGVPLLRVWKLILSRSYDYGIMVKSWSKKEYEWEGKTAPAEIAGTDDSADSETEAESATRANSLA
jgi:predicted phosphoadenosine phosphosulfate sulfurtransferase